MTTSSTTIEPLYAVDTNALIWYLTTSKKLSRRATEIFAAAERGETRLYISAVTLAEIYYANKKWQWFTDFATAYRDMKSKPYFRFVNFRAEEVLDFDRDAATPEMHDRIIAGVARRLAAPLITSDPVITAASVVRTVW